VLGPLEVYVDGRSIAVGGGRQRALLALLLVHAGEIVSRDRLIEELWGGRPPASGAQSLDVYVSRLRRALRVAGGGEVLVTRAPGYVLLAEETDARRFEALAAEGRAALAAGDAERASTLLREALGLGAGGHSWRWRTSTGRGPRPSGSRSFGCGGGGPCRRRAGTRSPRGARARAGAPGCAESQPRAARRPVHAGALPVRAAGRCARGLSRGASVAGR
jgi:Transcriptional regulatory protein, C terminal